MRLWTNCNKSVALNHLEWLLGLIAKADSTHPEYVNLIGIHCDIAFYRLWGGFFSIAPPKDFFFVLPKNELVMPLITDRWHEVMSGCFPRRDYQLNEREQAISEQIYAIQRNDRFRSCEHLGYLMEAASMPNPDNAELEAIPSTLEQDHLEAQVRVEILQTKLLAAASPEAERIYPEPFERSLWVESFLLPQVCRVDLKPLSWAIAQNGHTHCFVVDVNRRKNCLRLKQTRRHHKHAHQTIFVSAQKTPTK